MSLYAAAWVYFLALVLALAVIAGLAVSRRVRSGPVPAARPQVRWRCSICAYVFFEFERQRYVPCPRCGTLLDAEQDARGPDAAAAGG